MRCVPSAGAALCGKEMAVAVLMLLSGCHLLTQGGRGSAEMFYCLFESQDE